MPRANRHPCSYGPCLRLTYDARCDLHRGKDQRPRSPEGQSRQKMYNNTAWRTNRKAFIINHPLCIECETQGIVRLSSVVDHIIPHRGDEALFWNTDNWQALCKLCHDAKTRRGE